MGRVKTLPQWNWEAAPMFRAGQDEIPSTPPALTAAATVLWSVTARSFANGGFEQQSRQETDGIKPEIDIAGSRSIVRRSTSPMNWQAGH
jgi:hypothetical protein